eukprot:2435153-Prymnesium_polylepis.2
MPHSEATSPKTRAMLLALTCTAAQAQAPLGSDEMLRPFTKAIDGPSQPDEARRYRIIQGERVCGWSCDPSGPYYEQDKALCPAECRARGGLSMQSDPTPGQPGYGSPPPPQRRKGSYLSERISDVCSTPPPPLPAVSGRARCSDDAAAVTAAGVWMLIGVQTGPAHVGRRDGVRASWKQYEANTGGGVLVCFLIGRQGISPPTLAALDAEHARHGDIMFLANATDAGVPTIKGFHWWRAAAARLPPPG